MIVCGTRNVRNICLYTLIDVADYTISPADLFVGINLFGVNYAGAVTIHLPDSDISPRKVISISDESGAASSNNITIQVG